MLRLTRWELETWLREPDCGPERKHRMNHRTLKLTRQSSTLRIVAGPGAHSGREATGSNGWDH